LSEASLFDFRKYEYNLAEQSSLDFLLPFLSRKKEDARLA
jgi:hypothetical protein